MRHSIYILVFLLGTLFVSSFASSNAVNAQENPFTPVFSSVILDLPIMPGLTENAESAVIFDKPDGRVIQTSAFGAAQQDTIKLFYNRALPPLGWHSVKDMVFHRDGEVLKLGFEQAASPAQTTVSFTLTPQS